MTILQTLQSAFSNIGAVFADFRFNDFLDICFVAFLIYNVIKLIRETRTGQLVKGLVLLGVVYFLVTILGMQATGYLFSALFRDVILVLIVVSVRKRRENQPPAHLGLSYFREDR